jgi:two-component system response regulator RegX3
VPVIMVSAKDDEVDKVVGSSSAPTTTSPSRTPPGELVARHPRGAASWQRARPGPQTLEVGPVRMDVERHTVTVDGTDVRLPLKEFELLEMFLRNPGRVLTRGQLIDASGARLRRRHQDARRAREAAAGQARARPGEPKYLVTVRGLGYKLDL